MACAQIAKMPCPRRHFAAVLKMRGASPSIELTYAMRRGIIYLIKRTVRLRHPVAKQNQGI